MNRDILTVIQENMSTFSKGQKRIANYILESYDKAAFMTASRLGKTVSVSESTVVRFAAELGYDGYPSMQRSLQKMIRNRLTSVQRIEVSNDRIGDQDLLSSVLQSDIEKIRLTFRCPTGGRRRWIARALTARWTPSSPHGRSTSWVCGPPPPWPPSSASISI